VKLYSLPEAAKELGLTSTGSLRMQIAAGKLRASKVGEGPRGVWVVTAAELARYRRESLGQRRGKR
jgi:hypothetical protein